MSMLIKGQKTTTNEDGVDKEAFTIAFTNGALEELEHLQKVYDVANLEETVRLAIAILRRMEELKNESKPKE